MIHRERWGFRPEWLDYVKSSWEGRGRVELKHDDNPNRLAFEARARESFEALGIPSRSIKTYISIQIPKQGDGYDEGYPHIHYPLTGTTLVHYLQPGDKPAPLDIFDGDDVAETIYPEAGLTVFMPNSLKHGVRLNNGTQDRIQMIATALN